MSRTPKALALVPEPVVDPIMEQRAVVARHVEARTVQSAKKTAAAKALKEAEADFDAGTIDVAALAAIREVHASTERVYKRHEDAEQKEGVKLAQLEQAARKVEYDAAIARAQGWLARIMPSISALVALDEQLAKHIDEILDVVVDAQAEHDAAARLEADVRPLFKMSTNGIRRVELADVRFAVRVAIQLARAKVGREVPGEWLVAEPEPPLGSLNRESFDKAAALLTGGAK